MSVTSVPEAFSSEIYYVYAVLCRDGTGPLYVKFGHTIRLHERLRAVAQGSPIPAKWFAFIQVPGLFRQRALERDLHKHFSDRKVKGEWFRFDADCPEDRRAFNDGCAIQIAVRVGPGRFWEKVSVAKLDEWAKERQMAYLRAVNGKGKGRKAREKAARRELAKYGIKN